MRIFWTLISLKPPKKTVTFHSTGCLIGILTMVYHNPHITGQYNLLSTLNNRQVFFHCSIGSIYLLHNEDSHLSSYLHIGWKPLGPRDPGVRGLEFGEPVKPSTQPTVRTVDVSCITVFVSFAQQKPRFWFGSEFPARQRHVSCWKLT